MQANPPAGAGNSVPHSLVWATDVDVLAPNRVVLRRDGYWMIRSPSNPGFYWGNFLIFDAPPGPGDGLRWQAAFAVEFPDLSHCSLAWDSPEGDLGAARAEFPGFEFEATVGLIAAPDALVAHPRASTAVSVRALGDPDPAWDEVLALWEAQNADREEPHPPEAHRRFAESRLSELRALLAAGRGAWFVAQEDGRVVGSLGVVVTDGRARYQMVDTRSSHRRRGIASRLVFEAAQRIAEGWNVDRFVITADADYHALAIYASLGFEPIERVAGVCRWPTRIEP